MRHITRPEPDMRHITRSQARKPVGWAPAVRSAAPQQVWEEVPGPRFEGGGGKNQRMAPTSPPPRAQLSSARKKPQTRARCEVHQMQFFRLFGRPDVSTAPHHLSHHSRALISFMASAPPAIARRVSPPTATPNPPVHRLPRFVFFLMFKLAP
jgi:hypothetical protein